MNYKKTITDIAFVLLNLAMTIMACFLLMDFSKIIRVVVVLVFLLLCILIPTVSPKHKSIYRLLLTASVFMSFVFLAYVILRQLGWLYYLRDFEKIKAFILSTKQWGVIVFLAIIVFQVVVLPIPGAITILIGVAIYGPFWSFVLSVIGTYIGSILAFAMGRTFGKKLVVWLCGEEKTEKYARLLSEKGKVFFVAMLLFPFFPDDILCMVAGISSMSKKFFLISMMITRPIMIGFTAFFGSGEIIPFRGWGIPVWAGIFAATILIFVLITVIQNNIGKSKNKRNQKK